MKKLIVFYALIAMFGYHISRAQSSPVTVKKSTTRHGPEKGSLIIIGGGGSTPAIWAKFVELAGGKEKANIVVVTTATGDSAEFSQSSIRSIKKNTGVEHVTLLHTGDLAVANSDQFVAAINHATAVFFDGGRQWRPAQSYLNTKAHQAFLDLLDRGGVIAGSSAGASIQGSFLWRGDTEGAQVLIGDHTQGLGFLKNSAIDQHLLTRNRQFDLTDFIRQAPELIGIGLEQATAIWVHRDTLEVIGKSYVAIYDYNTIIGNGVKHVVKDKEVFTASSGPFFFLHEGQRYDLKNRQVIEPVPTATTRPLAIGKEHSAKAAAAGSAAADD
ncbi:cyanophycinase [Chitinophaga costaii]|uniref:Cyanophycinase n=1 Tax=Chitinophaga costaii TaxID=1335309 RepID=A0A1C4F720_9BACT|nr:cyanophycinase [Chitinophaga costaii]PUZ21251.1 peptidase S51 [Chitinophaga costaii]SCC51433.1 cyanophycinase [Chitinophaga costaii]